jgi:CxxC-x17-CxxC domain-containing protein
MFPGKVRNIQDPGFVPPPGFTGTDYLNNHRQTYSAVSGFNNVDSLLEVPHVILRRVVGGTNIHTEGEIPPMMSNAGYQDRILTCRDCGQDFAFTAGEQEFYASRGLTNDPSRCPACRAARRNGQSQSYAPRARSSSGEHYETTCATCGRPTSVPFIPSEGRPVYCSDCFQAQRASRGPRREESRSYSSNSYGNNYGSSGYGDSSYGGGRSDRGGRDHDRRDRRDNRDRW